MISEDELKELHRQAQAGIADWKPEFHAWRRFRHLLQHKVAHQQDCLFLETFVMVGFLAQARPHLIRQSFRSLRELRQRRKEQQLFFAFEEQLLSNGGGITLGNHGYTKKPIHLASESAIFAGLRDVTVQLNGIGYEVFLNSGTLLGLVRDGRLIKGDDDLDMFVFLHAQSHTDAAIEFVRLGETLKEMGHERATSASSGIIGLNRLEGFGLDLFPAYVIAGKLYIFPYSFGDLHVDDILPKRVCPVSGGPLPQFPEKLLRVNYGADWETPITLFQFPWARQQRKFASLLSELKKLAN